MTMTPSQIVQQQIENAKIKVAAYEEDIARAITPEAAQDAREEKEYWRGRIWGLSFALNYYPEAQK